MTTIIEQMTKLVEELNAYTKAYDEGKPLVSDKVWDDKYFQLQEMEKESGVVLGNSPTHSINYQVVNQLEKVKHNHPMLSLDKTKEYADFKKKFDCGQPYTMMLKMDGLTCSLMYSNGKLISAETRGDGEVGENILHNAMVIGSIPKQIPFKGDFVVDGEIICTYADFINFRRDFKNTRNFATGSIRLLDSKECAKRNLSFVAWDVIKGFPDINFFSEKLNRLNDYGFVVVPYIHFDNDKILSEEEFEEWKDNLRTCAEGYGYPIDGLVFKFDDIKYGKSLGSTEHHFNNALAYKFYDEVYETSLRDITWTIKADGYLIPTVHFDTVVTDESTLQKAYIHNVNILTSILGKYPYKGQKIKIFKANQIIPQVDDTSSLSNSKDKDVEYIPIPTECPQCGHSLLVDENGELRCVNPKCAGQVYKHIFNYAGKTKGLDIHGLGEQTIKLFMDKGLINSIPDIYTLKNHIDEILQIPKFGRKKLDGILNGIENSRTPSFAKFISAIGIPGISNANAAVLATFMGTWENFMEKVQDKYDFCELPNTGERTKETVLNFDYSEAQFLVDNYIKIDYNKSEETEKAEEQPLEGLRFCISGRLNKFKSKSKAEEYILKYGGTVADHVNNSVTYVLAQSIHAQTSKTTKARALGIPIITDEDLIKMCGFDF